jgi:hypothetical protein
MAKVWFAPIPVSGLPLPIEAHTLRPSTLAHADSSEDMHRTALEFAKGPVTGQGVGAPDGSPFRRWLPS